MKQRLSRQGIGASQVGTLAGMNPFSSPWDLWMELTGQTPPQPENHPMEWGHRLEPAIRQKYVDDTGAVVWVPPESLFHPENTWARATPDGIVVKGSADYVTHTDGYPILQVRNSWQHLLQIKNVSFWVGREWEKAPPGYVQLQEQFEMYVTGLNRADVACLIGGSDFRIFTIHRDDTAIENLVTIASDFWRRVQERIPPEIDNSAACQEYFEKRFATADAVEIIADDQLETVMEGWKGNVLMHKSIGKEIERYRNEVRSRLAEAQADRIVSRFGVAKLNKNKELMAPREWSKGE